MTAADALLSVPHAVFLPEVLSWARDDCNDALRWRMEHDGFLFYTLCFPDLCYLPFNRAHRWMVERWEQIPAFRERQAERWPNQRYAVEAPRGVAKTTLAKLELVRRLTFGLEPFIVWCGPGQDEALRESRHLRAMLSEPSPMYLELFGQPLVDGPVGKWTATVGEHTGGLACKGVPRQQVRGENLNGQRPTWFHLDDIEKPAEVRNLRLRNDRTEYVNSDIDNALPKEGGGVLMGAGTRLHPDSQTARWAASPAWETERFQAVQRWPDRQELWEECRALWADLTNPDRLLDAEDFYRRNRTEMDRGADVLDPSAQPVFALMVKLWSIGPREFYRDFQNAPRADGSALFDLDKARRCRFDGQIIVSAEGRKVRLTDCALGVWLDPRASDDAERNDFAAIAAVARDPHGYRYVLRCDMQRDKTSGARARMWRVYEWLARLPDGAVKFGFENNGSQALHGEGFEREREDRRKDNRPWRLFPTGYPSSTNKMDRIGRLEPDIEVHGWLQFATDLPPEVWEQGRDLPNGLHDDGWDAIERADWLASGGHMPVVRLGR